MTHLETLARLVESGDKATQGECEMRERRTGQRSFARDIVGNIQRDAIGRPLASTPVATVYAGFISSEANADYILLAANARPALRAHLAAVAKLVEAAAATCNHCEGIIWDEEPPGLAERIDALKSALKEVTS